MIYITPKDLPCDHTQLLSSLKSASNVYQETLLRNTSSSSIEGVCYALYTDICQPYFSVTCQPSKTTPSAELRPSSLETWGIGLLFICLVCSCAAFGVCLYPVMRKKVFKHILTWMIGLAIGSLSGIAVFQLLPQAFELSDETPEQVDNYVHKSLVILVSIYVFFLAERLFKMTMEHRKRAKTGEMSRATTKQSLLNNATQLDSASIFTANQIEGNNITIEGKEKNAMVVAEAEPHLHFHGHVENGSGGEGMQTVAWLILTGDSLHKFVDGLSIGAAFSISTMRGISIAIAILCEELPHELGDIAILLNSGLSLKRAISYNCISGLTCFVGFGVGVFLGELAAARTWIFAVASGMFIYISFVNILPEMTAAIEEAGRIRLGKGFVVLAIQTFGLVVGIVLMYVLARFSGEIHVGL